ncbi:hypothetical protein E4U59_005596 [Claviceps monticola]|nr:hypothetical protein E4U59_005596 [Claviceps monticola]
MDPGHQEHHKAPQSTKKRHLKKQKDGLPPAWTPASTINLQRCDPLVKLAAKTPLVSSDAAGPTSDLNSRRQNSLTAKKDQSIMSGPGSETSDGRSMQSRTGRNKQRYNSKGERLVAGVVPLSRDQKYVLLIQSTRRKGWVLPKGGWESDETCEEAATREAWEEAGIIIQITYDLGAIEEKRPPKSSKDRSQYCFFQATVLDEVADWPERHKRERQWFTYNQALDALTSRPELQEALQRSTMKRL